MNIYSVDSKVFVDYITSYLSLGFRDGFYDDKFTMNVVNKIENWNMNYIDDLLYLLEKIDEKPLLNKDDIINDIVSSVSNRISKTDINLSGVLTLRSLECLCKFQFASNQIYEKIFSEIGKNFSKIDTRSKIKILKLLGKRGIRNNEVFKVILYGISKKNSVEEIIECLTAVCDVNLEKEDYAQSLFSVLVEKTKHDFKMKDPLVSTNFGYVLAKFGASSELLAEYAKNCNMKNSTFFASRKRLILYQFMKHLDVNFGTQEDLEFLTEKYSPLLLWDYKNESIEIICEKLNENQIRTEVYGNVEGIPVTIAVPDKKTGILIKNKWNSTYDEKELKGEYQLLVSALQKKQVKVVVVEQKNFTKNFLSKYPGNLKSELDNLVNNLNS